MPSGTKRLALLDTNLLIDAVDPREQARAATASAIIEALTLEYRAIVTVQVAAEYFDNLTERKGRLAPIMSKSQAVTSLEGLLASCPCLDLTPVTIFLATRAAMRYSMRIYDAHLWATASINNIDLIITGDMPGQPVIEGVQYVDPFADGFQLADIGL